MFRSYRRDKIDSETPHVKGIDESDDPFEDGSRVPPWFAIADAEADGEAEFYEDEGEFYPEGDAKDAVFSVVDS